MAKKTVLSLGQCGADHGRIGWVLRTHFDAEVIGADTAEDALALLRGQTVDLVLVNRVFDLDAGSGQDFISRLKEEGTLQKIPVMLVSNYDDAQQEAKRRGALPGFGKAALVHPATLGLLGKILTEVGG